MTSPVQAAQERPTLGAHPLATLVATDGSEAARAAVRIAAALSGAGRIAPQLIVVDPAPPRNIVGETVEPGDVAYALRGADALGRRRADLRESLQAEGAGDWHLHVRFGDAADEIARDVARGRFELLMLGLAHHGPVDRVTRRETTLRISRQSEVPIFAVAYWLHHLPRRIIVGLDFSRASERAAVLACHVLAEGGTLTLAHPDAPTDADLQSITARLPLPVGGRIETLPLNGSPSAALLELADRSSADVIAVGCEQRDALSRMVTGSVSADLIRHARCSLLVTPPSLHYVGGA